VSFLTWWGITIHHNLCRTITYYDTAATTCRMNSVTKQDVPHHNEELGKGNDEARWFVLSKFITCTLTNHSIACWCIFAHRKRKLPQHGCSALYCRHCATKTSHRQCFLFIAILLTPDLKAIHRNRTLFEQHRRTHLTFLARSLQRYGFWLIDKSLVHEDRAQINFGWRGVVCNKIDRCTNSQY